MVATQFLRSHVTINEFRPTRNKRFNFLVRIYALGGDGDVNYCPRLADDSVVSKSIYDHVTPKKLGCDHNFV